ncbi:hypothetical protein Ancab_025961, partial [Ancistrocladus abbreviatus]
IVHKWRKLPTDEHEVTLILADLKIEAKNLDVEEVTNYPQAASKIVPNLAKFALSLQNETIWESDFPPDITEVVLQDTLIKSNKTIGLTTLYVNQFY